MTDQVVMPPASLSAAAATSPGPTIARITIIRLRLMRPIILRPTLRGERRISPPMSGEQRREDQVDAQAAAHAGDAPGDDVAHRAVHVLAHEPRVVDHEEGEQQ